MNRSEQPSLISSLANPSSSSSASSSSSPSIHSLQPPAVSNTSSSCTYCPAPTTTTTITTTTTTVTGGPKPQRRPNLPIPPLDPDSVYCGLFSSPISNEKLQRSISSSSSSSNTSSNGESPPEANPSGKLSVFLTMPPPPRTMPMTGSLIGAGAGTGAGGGGGGGTGASKRLFLPSMPVDPESVHNFHSKTEPLFKNTEKADGLASSSTGTKTSLNPFDVSTSTFNNNTVKNDKSSASTAVRGRVLPSFLPVDPESVHPFNSLTPTSSSIMTSSSSSSSSVSHSSTSATHTPSHPTPTSSKFMGKLSLSPSLPSQLTPQEQARRIFERHAASRPPPLDPNAFRSLLWFHADTPSPSLSPLTPPSPFPLTPPRPASINQVAGGSSSSNISASGHSSPYASPYFDKGSLSPFGRTSLNESDSLSPFRRPSAPVSGSPPNGGLISGFPPVSMCSPPALPPGVFHKNGPQSLSSQMLQQLMASPPTHQKSGYHASSYYTPPACYNSSGQLPHNGEPSSSQKPTPPPFHSGVPKHLFIPVDTTSVFPWKEGEDPHKAETANADTKPET